MRDRGLGFLLTVDRAARAAAMRTIGLFRKYNREELTLFVVVPDEDVVVFAGLSADDVTLLPLSSLGTSDRRAGVVDLAFWELGLVTAYVTLPSGLQFLRPFGCSDFLHSDGVPFLFASAERELRTDPAEGLALALEQDRLRGLVRDSLGGGELPGDAYAGPAVLSATVLRSLRTDHMEPARLGYAELIDACPDAAVWHNTWLRKTDVVSYELREPVVRMLRTSAAANTYRLMRVEVVDLARGYVAVVNDSGVDLQPLISRPRLIGRAIPMRDLRRALTLRLLRRAPRVQRLLGLDLDG